MFYSGDILRTARKLNAVCLLSILALSFGYSSSLLLISMSFILSNLCSWCMTSKRLAVEEAAMGVPNITVVLLQNQYSCFLQHVIE